MIRVGQLTACKSAVDTSLICTKSIRKPSPDCCRLFIFLIASTSSCISISFASLKVSLLKEGNICLNINRGNRLFITEINFHVYFSIRGRNNILAALYSLSLGVSHSFVTADCKVREQTISG